MYRTSPICIPWSFPHRYIPRLNALILNLFPSVCFRKSFIIRHPCFAVRRSGLVGSSGLEPPTSRLSGARSNHLSYEPIQFPRCISFPSLTLLFASGGPDWWRWWESNPWPPACRAGALPAELHPHIFIWGLLLSSLSVTQNWTTSYMHKLQILTSVACLFWFALFPNMSCAISDPLLSFSIERRWSSRTFRYGYLVTT